MDWVNGDKASIVFGEMDSCGEPVEMELECMYAVGEALEDEAFCRQVAEQLAEEVEQDSCPVH